MPCSSLFASFLIPAQDIAVAVKKKKEKKDRAGPRRRRRSTHKRPEGEGLDERDGDGGPVLPSPRATARPGQTEAAAAPARAGPPMVEMGSRPGGGPLPSCKGEGNTNTNTRRLRLTAAAAPPAGCGPLPAAVTDEEWNVLEQAERQR